MSDTINDGGPAFPGYGCDTELRSALIKGHVQHQIGVLEVQRLTQHLAGMSLRDWFAGQALAGLCAHTTTSLDEAVKWSWRVADEMLKARKEQP